MSTKTKILIAEHDPQDLELLNYELEKGGINYISAIAQNEEDYRTAIINFMPDIILSDYTFPSFDGPTAFKIREMLAPDTPFIFVSGTIGEENSIELIKTGVTDYVLKDKLFTLTTKIKRALKESKEKYLKNKIGLELIQSENRLARAQQVAHIGSWELDFITNNVHWSDETFRIYGLPPNEKRQSFETTLAFIHPEDADFVLKKINEGRDSLHGFFINYRIVLKNGFTRHIYLEGKPDFDSSGKPAGLHGTAQDVTETVLLENKLVQERLVRQSEITAAVLTAQETDRANIGRELHENLGQTLAVAKMYIQMANTYEENREMYLNKSCDMIAKVIEEVRKISKTLVIPGIHIIGLFDNIKNLVNDLFVVHPLKIEFQENNIHEEDMDETLQLTIFRIVQEQVNNILKHAKATRATIRISRQENQVILHISDNGKGCDFLTEKGGVGIINIRSRAELRNGGVTIVSNPGEGYQLKVVLPIDGNLNKPALLRAMQKS